MKKESNKKSELRNEYESSYLAYINTTDYLSFEDWLVINKGYKPKNKTKDELIERVLTCIENDILKGDTTVLYELLGLIDTKHLIGSLNESEWILYNKLK